MHAEHANSSIASLVGILSNLVKGGDLILREHQKMRVQSFCETATLRLEELKPLRWFVHLTTPHANMWLLVIGGIEIAALYVYSLIMMRREPSFGTLTGIEIVMQVIAIALSVASIPYIIRKIGPRTMRWLFGDGRIPIFIRRYVKFVLSGYAIGFILLSIFFLSVWLVSGSKSLVEAFVDEPSFDQGGWVYVAGSLLVGPFLTFFVIVFQVGGLVGWCILTFFLLEIALKLLRGFAWRVVEYSKGAFAALILLFTVLLGFVSLYLKGSI
jgi:hypothetical protein